MNEKDDFKKRMTVYSIMIAVLFTAAHANSQQKEDSTPELVARSAPRRSYVTDKGPLFGCVHQEFLKKIQGYHANNDQTAFTKAVAAALLTGECVRLERGEEVFLVDWALFSGLVKIRPKGETAEYWTFQQIIKEEELSAPTTNRLVPDYYISPRPNK